jgi:hypothetical protein
VSHPEGAFEHCACIYSGDAQFLDTAVPFLAAGLELGQPVLAVTTPAHLELLGAALGARSGEVDYADSASFHRQAARRVAAFHRYWKGSRGAAAGALGTAGTPGATAAARGSRPGGPGGVRILAEPVWAGRSAREITAWTRMEAALNVTLAPAGISMLCPYDASSLDTGIVANALHTHPVQAAGLLRTPSAGYADPADFARSCDTAPLPAPPATAEAFDFDGDLRGLRRFVAASAAAHGMADDRAGMLVLAVSEVGAYLKSRCPASAAVRTWGQQGAVACDVWQPGGGICDPFLGLRPAELVPADGDGLWLAHQICDWMDIRSSARGCAIQMQVQGSGDARGTTARPGRPGIS